MSSYTYAAFLRGINVGGKKKVQMAQLREALERSGLQNVVTILNSGNVIFESTQKEKLVIQQQIETKIKDTFGFHVDTVVRKKEEIEGLIQLDPFKNVEATNDTRLYVTFLPNGHNSKLKIPYISPEKDFTILHVSDTEVCSVLDLTKGKKTTDAMKILEKEYGKNITTRNWNTLLRVKTKL